MYLHLGQDTLVNTKEVVGLFDLDTTTISKHTRAFLKKAETEYRVINVSDELPKSFVVTTGTNNPVYVSQLAAPTLKKRLEAQQVKHIIDTK